MSDDEEQVVEKGEFSETKESGSDLEEMAESSAIGEVSGFSESMVPEAQDMPTPTLSSESSFSDNSIQESSGFQNEQSLEESAGSVSSGISSEPKQEENFQASKYHNVYNMPDYSGGSEQDRAFKDLRKRGMQIDDFEEAGRVQHRVTFDENPDIVGSRPETANPNDLREYLVTEVEHLDDSPRSVLDRRRDYRPLKR